MAQTILFACADVLILRVKQREHTANKLPKMRQDLDMPTSNCLWFRDDKQDIFNYVLANIIPIQW